MIAAFFRLSETASDAVLEFVVEQLGIASVGAVKGFVDRAQRH